MRRKRWWFSGRFCLDWGFGFGGLGFAAGCPGGFLRVVIAHSIWKLLEQAVFFQNRDGCCQGMAAVCPIKNCRGHCRLVTITQIGGGGACHFWLSQFRRYRSEERRVG